MPDFSHAKLKPCMRKADAKNLLPDCFSENAIDESSHQALAAVWLRLACTDETEGFWLAQRMVERTEYSPLADFLGWPYFPWFAKPLQQAAQDPKNCPGLDGLPEDYKARLQSAASK